jgi:hypothetical protein
MDIELNPGAVIRKLAFGRERAPLLVIDDFVNDPDALVRHAARRVFTERWRWFPGTRTRAPLAYRRLLAERLRDVLCGFFGLGARSLTFSMCHYSLITTPADRLETPQRIPHFDSVGSDGIASIHYLFRAPHGGTAFYRHRRTGFEFVDASRNHQYLRTLEEELAGPHAPAAAYINGDTPLFEQVEMHEGRFNRILFYRRNSLHSGCIGSDFVPDPDPLTGRLSINSFIDTGP